MQDKAWVGRYVSGTPTPFLLKEASWMWEGGYLMLYQVGVGRNLSAPPLYPALISTWNLYLPNSGSGQFWQTNS